MYAERNRKIKKVLSEAFKPAKVTVRGSRGTATGWVSIKVDFRPKDDEQRQALKVKCDELFKAAGITFGTYGYDDPGSDYGFGRTMMLEFDRCLDQFIPGERVEWNGRAGTVKDKDYQAGGDWYLVDMDDNMPGTPAERFYKKDLKAIEAQQEAA